MKLGSNIAVKNVLQVYVTEATIFYVISLKKARTTHTHTLTGAGGSTYSYEVKEFSLPYIWIN